MMGWQMFQRKPVPVFWVTRDRWPEFLAWAMCVSQGRDLHFRLHSDGLRFPIITCEIGINATLYLIANTWVIYDPLNNPQTGFEIMNEQVLFQFYDKVEEAKP
jgi:hypothetical protein